MLSRFAYRTTGLAIKTIVNLSKAEISYHGENNIPAGPNIFVINHFTRLETFLMPYMIFQLTKIPVWSLASFELFKGRLWRIPGKGWCAFHQKSGPGPIDR